MLWIKSGGSRVPSPRPSLTFLPSGSQYGFQKHQSNFTPSLMQWETKDRGGEGTRPRSHRQVTTMLGLGVSTRCSAAPAQTHFLQPGARAHPLSAARRLRKPNFYGPAPAQHTHFLQPGACAHPLSTARRLRKPTF